MLYKSDSCFKQSWSNWIRSFYEYCMQFQKGFLSCEEILLKFRAVEVGGNRQEGVSTINSQSANYMLWLDILVLQKGAICRYKSSFSSSEEKCRMLKFMSWDTLGKQLNGTLSSSWESLASSKKGIPKLLSDNAVLNSFHSLHNTLLLLRIYIYSVLITCLLSSRIESDNFIPSMPFSHCN